MFLGTVQIGSKYNIDALVSFNEDCNQLFSVLNIKEIVKTGFCHSDAYFVRITVNSPI